MVALKVKAKQSKKGKVLIESLSKKFKENKQRLQKEICDGNVLKQLFKAEKKQKKLSKKQSKKQTDNPKRLFVIDFHGDIQASEVEALREMITVILQLANNKDEVLIRLESAGGMVHAYGLCASQLQRLKQHGIHFKVSIDKVAASGGYMMACVADKILAAPFAVIGSIGVIVQMPNFNRLLAKKDIEFEQITAGKYKRTLTLFGKNTKENRAKMQQDVEETHDLFKDFVSEQRPQLDIKKVATGEHWFGTRALELNLVDQITTSDDYILDFYNQIDSKVFRVFYKEKNTAFEKMVGKKTADSIKNLLLGATSVSRVY